MCITFFVIRLREIEILRLRSLRGDVNFGKVRQIQSQLHLAFRRTVNVYLLTYLLT